MAEGVRIDKWLWSVRIYKTRNMAAEACRSGKVRINDKPVKPSHEVRLNEEISINLTPIVKTVKVVGLLKNRVSAKLVEDYLEDLTPQEEYDKLKLMRELNYEFRRRGEGRPTKKQRRMIDVLKKSKF
jgi:ribosome-associated heat shock protein Hsp15